MRKRLILLLSVGVILLFIPIAKLFLPLSKAEYRVVSLFHGEKAYDVIVIGGEPEGVAAAVSAARAGAKTLLIEHRDGLGGLMTYGRLNYIDLGLDKDKKPANAGIFKEWHKMVGGGIAFDVDKAQEAFTKLTEDEPNLTVLLDSDMKAISLSRDQHTIDGILVDTPDGKKAFTAKRFVDSTANADFAAMAGVPYFVGQEDIGLKNTKMSVTLMIHLKNVDWNKLKQVAAKKTFGEASVNDKVAWGFWGVSEQYKPHLSNTRLRGMNIARQSDGTIYINALQIFGVNGLSEKSREKAIEEGKVETKYIVEFLNNHFPGFENASIVDYPPELYVRETRHIKALYQLSIQDVWENRDQWDSIGFGSYPVDIQATTPTGKDQIVINPKQYAIPFRSLVPLNFNNLLVASRSSGYSSLAAGSARIIPTGMTAGEAAGLASAISINKGEYYPKMVKDKPAIQLLQARLIKKGAHLYHFNIDYPYEGKWYYPSLVPLYSEGLIYAGYTNDLHLDEKISEKEFISLIEKGVKRTHPKRFKQMKWPNHLKKGPLTRDRAASLILKMENAGNKQNHPWDALLKKGLINDALYQRLPENRELLKSEAYVLAEGIIFKP
jgi:hypothetical protein